MSKFRPSPDRDESSAPHLKNRRTRQHRKPKNKDKNVSSGMSEKCRVCVNPLMITGTKENVVILRKTFLELFAETDRLIAFMIGQ